MAFSVHRLAFVLGDIARFTDVLSRFPLPTALAATFTLLQLLTTPRTTLFGRVELIDIQLSLAFGFFWALSANLAARARGWPLWLEARLALGGIAFTAVIMLTTPDAIFMPAVMLGEAAILTTLAAASSGLRAQDNDALWRFTAVALEGAAIALVAAVILAVGLSILVASIAYLFELPEPGRIIFDIWTVCFGFFWPLRALSTLPRPQDPPDSLKLQFNAALPFLLDWALVPIWCAYLAVLYAYAGKILIDWSLPRGNVAWMVHGFGALGVAVWLMVWPRRDSGPALTRFFQRWFWWTLPIPLLLLAIGILERIGAYGWTEPRYMVAVGGLWLAAMALLYGLWPRRVPLALAPLSLALLCVLATFGPWSAVSVSVRDQQARLSELLTRNGILAQGRIVTTQNPKSIPPADARGIFSAIDFLVTHQRTAEIAAWTGLDRAADHSTRLSILMALGLQDLDHAGQYFGTRRTVTTAFNQTPRNSNAVFVDVTGATMLAEAQFQSSESVRTITSPDGRQAYRVRFDAMTSRLQVIAPGEREVSIDLAPAFADLFEKGGSGKLSLEQSKSAIITAGTALRVRIVIRSVMLEQTPTGLVGRDLSFLLALSGSPP